MIRKPITKHLETILGVSSILVLVSIYAFLSHRQHLINPRDTILPNLEQFKQGWVRMLTPDSSGDVWLWKDASTSLWRLFTSLAMGISASFVLGVAMGVSSVANAFFKWPLLILGSIAPTAMLAVYFVVFGTELAMYNALIGFGIMAGLTIAISNTVQKDVSEYAIYKAYTLGASQFEVIWDVVVRQIAPRVINLIRLSIGPALILLIAAEWNISDVGFGYRLRMQSRLLGMNVVYSYLAIIGLIGFLIDMALLQIRKRLCPWFDL